MEEVVLGILVTDGKILLTDIPPDYREFAGMVGFPGGDVDDEDNLAAALKRLVFQKTGVKTEIEQKLGTVKQFVRKGTGDDRTILIHVYELEEIERPEYLAPMAFREDVDELDETEIAPSNLSMFQRMYQDGITGNYRSIVEQDKNGDYRQTEFEFLGD